MHVHTNKIQMGNEMYTCFLKVFISQYHYLRWGYVCALERVCFFHIKAQEKIVGFFSSHPLIFTLSHRHLISSHFIYVSLAVVSDFDIFRGRIACLSSHSCNIRTTVHEYIFIWFVYMIMIISGCCYNQL